MLSWLKTAPESDHPLADPKAAKEILSSLPTGTPLVALETLAEYLDSVREAAGLSAARTLEIIEHIDQTGKPFHRLLTREYLDHGLQHRAAGMRIAHVEATFWDCLAKAYRMALESHEVGDPTAQNLRAKIPMIGARAIRAFNLHLKWCLLRYTPVDPGLWGSLARVFSIAERHKVASVNVEVYPGPWGISSVRREMLKAMMLAVSSTDALPKPQIEIVERICAQYSEFFTLQEQPAPGVHFRFDLDTDHPPARALGAGHDGPGMRYFGPSAAAPHLKKLAQDIRATGAVPSTVNLGSAYPVYDVVRVLEHLAHYWAPIPPARREKRRPSEEGIEVVHGFGDIVAAVDAEEFGWNFDVNKYEDWGLSDESPAGFGAVVPAGRGDWVTLGDLVGVRYLDEGVAWGVGIVRRLSVQENNQRQIGIELLSRGAIRVALSSLRSDGTHNPDPRTAVDAMLLPSSSDNSVGRLTTRIAVKPGSFDLRSSYGLMLYGMDYLLVPKGVIEQTEDYAIAEYRLLLKTVD
ncbi:MAG: hypothetical protein JNL33_08070 [Betaproteobacteria bacterium]|nr:hypothetical protein [Betaproteobacteria bacterium]